MQQADRADSAMMTRESSGNLDTFSPRPTRRSMLGIAAGAAIVALPTMAEPRWTAPNWITRWHREGCGVRLDGRGMLQLTPRPGAEQEASTLLGELNSAERVGAVRDVLARVDDGCPALRAVANIEQIDREFISDDDDFEACTAWWDRWQTAYDRLEHIPASTGRGLAAKLRQGMTDNGGESGDRIIEAALRQLENWA